MVNRSDMGSLAGRRSVEGERSNRKAGAQAMSGSNHAARRVKLQNGGFFDLWKGAGASLEMWSPATAGGEENTEDVATEERGVVTCGAITACRTQPSTRFE